MEPCLQPLGSQLHPDSGRIPAGPVDLTVAVDSFPTGVALAFLEAMEDEGRTPTLEGMTAWVDAAFLNEVGVPAVCFGPGSIAQAHAAREWVEVEELEVGARILSRFVRRFLRSPGAQAEEAQESD